MDKDLEKVKNEISSTRGVLSNLNANTLKVSQELKNSSEIISNSINTMNESSSNFSKRVHGLNLVIAICTAVSLLFVGFKTYIDYKFVPDNIIKVKELEKELDSKQSELLSFKKQNSLQEDLINEYKIKIATLEKEANTNSNH